MSAHAYGAGASMPLARNHFVHSHGSSWSDTHDIGSFGLRQVADQPETRYRCEGRVQESTGANIRSCST